MIKRHERSDARGRRSLTDDVLQGCGSHQFNSAGVPVQPKVVGNNTNGVELTVDQRDTVKGREHGLVFLTRVDHLCLRETFHIARAFNRGVVALFHEHDVKGAVFSVVDVPEDRQTPSLIFGGIDDRRSGHGRRCFVVVRVAGWNDGSHNRDVGQVLLTGLVHTGEPNPHGNTGREGKQRLVAFVGQDALLGRPSQGVRHRCCGEVDVGHRKVKSRASGPFEFNIAFVVPFVPVGGGPRWGSRNFIAWRGWTKRRRDFAPATVRVFCDDHGVIIHAVNEFQSVGGADVG